MNIQRVSVVGLGKLGACLAAILANAGYHVTGVDLDQKKVDAVNAGEAPVIEPQLDAYINAAGDRLQATTSIEVAAEAEATFIVVNTPSTESGRYELEAIKGVCRDLGAALAGTEDDHLVVITSTVFPGSTTGEIQTWLESASGRQAGEGFQLCYSPEFIAIGDVIDGLKRPDFFLIGEHSVEAGDHLVGIYERIRDNSAPFIRMDPTSAEVAKMAVNSFVTTKISFANTLSQLSDGVGADVDQVTRALAADSRISPKYLTAGTRYGGPCLPRDNTAFYRLAEDAGTRAPIALATDEVNEYHTTWIADAIRDKTPTDGTVAVLGVTYKPGTYIAKESQGLKLIEELARDFDLRCYDPHGVECAPDLPAGADFSVNLAEALEGADCAVLTVLWDEFTDPRVYSKNDLVLVDPWRAFDAGDLHAGVRYVPLGALNPI